MGSSQSRSHESKHHSRVGDQLLKSVLRRPAPTAQENNEDAAKPQSTSVTIQEPTNGSHDKTPTPETEPKKASTAQEVLCSLCYLWLCHYNLFLSATTTTCLHASHCSLSSNTQLLFPHIPIRSSYRSTELGRRLEVALMPS